jgi:hypothetical protein
MKQTGRIVVVKSLYARTSKDCGKVLPLIVREERSIIRNPRSEYYSLVMSEKYLK